MSVDLWELALISYRVKRRSSIDQFFYSGRIVAAFATGGAVLAGLSVGWVPALAALDVHVIGAAIGGVAGVIANARHLV